MLRRAEVAYENPMIDRDPVPTWQDGPVLLVGDAAHAMYPTGSNGASQAVMDARLLGAQFDDIDDVVPEAERAAFMAGYKAAAGFAVDRLNAAPPTIPPGARAVVAG
nr:FAD-dependent monooxygenase [Cellulomonas uda]